LLPGKRCRNLADANKEALDHRAQRPVLQCDDADRSGICVADLIKPQKKRPVLPLKSRPGLGHFICEHRNQ